MEESMERNRNWKRVIIVRERERERERAVFLLFWEMGTKSCFPVVHLLVFFVISIR
jgi:hypothetical protein